MAELEAAVARLNLALEKLEQHVTSLVEVRASARRQEAEIHRVGAERESLLGRIAELEEEGRALAGITEEVEIKLDSAIAEIRAVLGR
jgi:chromosome segregation ATPase